MEDQAHWKRSTTQRGHVPELPAEARATSWVTRLLSHAG